MRDSRRGSDLRESTGGNRNGMGKLRKGQERIGTDGNG